MEGSTANCSPRLVGETFMLATVKTKVSLNNFVDPSKTIIANVDSGASIYYFISNTKTSLIGLQLVCNPTIILSNDQQIYVVATAHIPLPNFSSTATKTYLLGDLKEANLISLRQLYDDNCHIVLTKTCVYTRRDKNVLLIDYHNIIYGI